MKPRIFPIFWAFLLAIPSLSRSATWLVDIVSQMEVGFVTGDIRLSEPKCLDISLKITPSILFRNGPEGKCEISFRRDGYSYGSFKPSMELSGELGLDWNIGRDFFSSFLFSLSSFRNGMMLGDWGPEPKLFDGEEKETSFKLGYSVNPMVHPYGALEVRKLWARYEGDQGFEERSLYWKGISLGLLVHHRILGDGRLEYKSGELMLDKGIGKPGDGISILWTAKLWGKAVLSFAFSSLSTVGSGSEIWRTTKEEFALAFELPMGLYPSASIARIVYMPKIPSGGERYTVVIRIAKKVFPAFSVILGIFSNSCSWNTNGEKKSFSNTREMISISLSL